MIIRLNIYTHTRRHYQLKIKGQIILYSTTLSRFDETVLANLDSNHTNTNRGLVLRSKLTDNPMMREEWLNSPIPILDSRCPKSYLDTASDRDRLMRVLQEIKYGETA